MEEQTENVKSILEDLTDSVITLNEQKAVETSYQALEAGINAYTAVTDGLARGMEIMGDRYESGICFVPELLIASDAMYAGMDILKPHLTMDEDAGAKEKYRGVIGVIEGDTHDIGKNLVKIMFEADGFAMTDLGRDVSIRSFLETAVNEEADLICISTLMTTAMSGMKDAIALLEKEGVRDRFKVMVGGACVSPEYARRIGADGYAPSAASAVRTGRELLKGRTGG